MTLCYKNDVHEWEGINLAGANLSGAKLDSVDLRLANLTDAVLDCASLAHARLRGAELARAALTAATLNNADLAWGNLQRAQLNSAILSHANVESATLHRADLEGANLEGANLNGTDLSYASFHKANLEHASLQDARLQSTNLDGSTLLDVDVQSARLHSVIFGDVDLGQAKNLETVEHFGPSTIGTNTLELSKGRIPDAFLRGCGLRPWQILEAKLYDPDLTPAKISELQYRIFDARTSGPLMLGGVFISYSHADAGFVDQVRDKLQESGVPVWLDRHDAVAGPLQKQIDRAIGMNNAVLLVLSKDSIASDWVEHEMKAARRIERNEGRDVLCPVALDDSWKEKQHDVKWEHLTDKNILDFSQWKTKAFAGQFQKLLKGLKIYYTRDEDQD